MDRIEYTPNPPPQSITEQSAKDLALYLQNELTQISSFIGELSDTPDTPTSVGYGCIELGVLTCSSNNIVSRTTGTFGNYATFNITTASPLSSTAKLQTTIEGVGTTSTPLVCGGTSYVSANVYNILVGYSDVSATVPTACSFEFITYSKTV